MTFNEILNLGIRRTIREISFEDIVKEYLNRIGISSGIVYAGANTGQELHFLEPLTEKIYAFEPINSLTVWGELLNKQNDKIVCINVALSDKDEDDILIYPASNNFESSSLFKPNTHLSEFSWVEFGEPIKVNAKRLDSFPFHKNFDVLIMDVQGAEYKVLNGISNFENIKLIILEYGIPDSYFGACSFQEINDLLSKAGFVYQESFSTYYNETTKAYFANAVFLKIDGVQHMLDQTNPWNKTENFEGEVKVYYDNLLKHLMRFKNKTFVETGTYIGNGLNCAIKAGFDKCYSIEIHKNIHEIAVNRFDSEIKNNKVKLFCGNSEIYFKQIISCLTDKTTFWLDAHISSQYGQMLAKNCPIFEELEAIKNHNIKEHTILIDDMDCFGNDMHDNIKIGDVIEYIRTINPNYRFEFLDSYFPNNILVAYVSS